MAALQPAPKKHKWRGDEAMANVVNMTEAPNGGNRAESEPTTTGPLHHEVRGDTASPEPRPETRAPPTGPDVPTTEPPMPASTGAASRRRGRPSLRTLLMTAGILVVIVGSTVFWLRGGRYATTDDALVQAAKLLVTADVTGLVSSVSVREGQTVKAGDMLFQLDLLPFQIAVNSAKANLDQTALTIESMKADYKVTLSNVDAQQSQVDLDQVTYDRDALLVKNDNVSRALFDQSRYTLQLDKNKLVSMQQQANVELAKLAGNPDLPTASHPLYQQAKAQVDEAQRQLDHATVRAPFSGVVTQVDALQPGTYLVSQTAALTGSGAIALVSTDRVWITAQMKETDLTYVKPGNHVDVTVDTYPGQVWSGRVESISPASDSEFSVLPAENSSGNWVKVVQRIPVRIVIDHKADTPDLRSGMSAYVSIDTGHRRSLLDFF
jgi:membrane fusion protein (multidrug efflux system)